MSTPKLALLGAGAAVAAAGLVYWVRRRAHAPDPLADDPSRETIDALDALAFEDEPGLDGLPDDDDGDDVEVDVIVDDIGELYGVHTPHAADTDLGYADHYRGEDEGDSWMESLEMTSAEGGPRPEEEVDVVDETGGGHERSDTRDRPVADKGAGGRGGL